MKRFIVILAILLPALSGWAQEVEMFSLEKEIEVPIIPIDKLLERVWTWLRTYTSVPATVYDNELNPIGRRADWVWRRCVISFKGRDYPTEYNFSLSIIPTEDGHCRICLFRPLVSSHRGNTPILSLDDLPVFYVGYSKGMFRLSRNREARFAICDEVKRLLTEEFEQVIPDIEQALWDRAGEFELIQE
jgi:hypothetical protein